MIADLLSNFWVALVAKLLLVALAIPLIGMVVGFGEMKLSAKMQARVGPYFAGGRWGWAQLLADGIKFFQKEDLIPRDADKPVFKFAPVVVMMGTVALFVVIPWGPGLIFRDLSVGIFYALAISSLTTVGVLMAGWSSANKYSLIGGLRAAGQMIAYELPLVFSALAVVIMAGTMSMQGIVEAQIEAGYPFVILQIVGFVIFVIASLAELSRIPFDLPIAESELVMGYLTEYSGFRFLFFFLAEFANMFSMSAIAVTLFLGGWYLPGIPADALEYLGPVILVVKSLILVFAMIWFRWAFPRVRQDQLQSLAWKWLIPISLANVILTGVFKVVL
ncbi:MAG: NADH-quinone oxidoreductase subunit NuoH [Actinomycetes bacterium]|jgi:NADH-quinone oxidoreductase subunit H|nr:MAG: NADH-quinone oxidoreductase subunit NuoH [Actinomycetota bacterium]